MLLYGPPGTGKTHTVRYLLSELTSLTTFVLSGRSLSLIGQACALARVFQPSMVVMEDIDLIAGDRSFGPVGANPLLFEVLNQIDGLGDDVDVTFLLTTNRVDILERALAERPGRVDAAVEIAPPDRGGSPAAAAPLRGAPRARLAHRSRVGRNGDRHRGAHRHLPARGGPTCRLTRCRASI